MTAIVNIDIPANTMVLLGKPSKPMGAEIVDSLKIIVSGVDEIIEAHILQCYAINIMEGPAQILVIVVKYKWKIKFVKKKLQDLLSSYSKINELVVWCITNKNSFLSDVINPALKDI